MSRILPLSLALLSLGGCVVYDKPCHDDGFWNDDTGDGFGGQDGGTHEPEPELGIVLTPDTLEQGETAIVSMQADLDFDWSTVEEIVFYGDVTPCAMQARADELLVTLSVAADAEAGAVDMVLELKDGEAHWVDDALFVVEVGGSGGGSGSGSGDGSADGSGDGSADGSGNGNGSGGC